MAEYMFVTTFRFSTLKVALVLLGLGVIIAFALWPRGTAVVQADVNPKNAGVSTNAKRVQFLESYGWKVDSNALEVVEVTIPQTFNAVYNNYNVLQKQQGFDLSGYKGKRVKRWTYKITNYPNATDDVRANILIYNNVVIGGDVSTVALNGFMQGFAMSSNPLTGDTAQNANIAQDIFTVSSSD